MTGERAAREWRPQGFGRRNAKDVRDPVIEPLWEGERLLVHVIAGIARATDAEGEPFELDEELAAAVAAAVRADAAVLDAYLTSQPAGPPPTGFVVDVEVPSAGEMATQLLVGRGRSRRRELARSLPSATPSEDGVLVVVDLLALDEDPLLDVPLLERKRLLESVVDEQELVRHGAYVRPPVDAWLGTWRALGFHSVAYKAANSRYQPGAQNDAWAIALIPRR